MIRVVIVEDSPVQLGICRDAVQRDPGLRLVGAHGSAEEAMAAVDWAGVDVLLTDLELPGESGVALIARAREANPGLLAMPLTVHEDTAIVRAALEVGATGYLLKQVTPEEITRAIHDLARGQSPISPVIGRHLIAAFHRAPLHDPTRDLSPREAEVLRAVAAGRSYKEVATALGISVHTVNAHLKNVYSKLHASGRGEALRRARLMGYVRAGDVA